MAPSVPPAVYTVVRRLHALDRWRAKSRKPAGLRQPEAELDLAAHAHRVAELGREEAVDALHRRVARREQVAAEARRAAPADLHRRRALWPATRSSMRQRPRADARNRRVPIGDGAPEGELVARARALRRRDAQDGRDAADPPAIDDADAHDLPGRGAARHDDVEAIGARPGAQVGVALARACRRAASPCAKKRRTRRTQLQVVASRKIVWAPGADCVAPRRLQPLADALVVDDARRRARRGTG